MTASSPLRTTARWLALSVLLALAFGARSAAAGVRLEAWKGHVSLGYAKVFSDSLAPGGSLSIAAGVEYPLAERWRLGPALSFNLLGSATVTRGSVTAAIDYSMFELAMLASYLPARGPVTRWTFGAGLASPRAELSVPAGGAAFADLALQETRPEFALDATLMSRRTPIVAVGLEVGTRIVPVSVGTWTLTTLRLAIHF